MDSCLKGKAQSLIQFLLGSHTSSRCEKDPSIQPCYTPIEKPLGLFPSCLSLLSLAVTEVQNHPLLAQDTPFPVLLSCLTQLPKLCTVPSDPMHKQLLKNSVFSNFSEHPLPSATSIPFQTLAWPLAS